MWNDKITGNESLNSVISISEIKQWLINKGIFKLSDIISWDNSGNWESWSLPELTDRDHVLHAQQKILLELIPGMAPVHPSCKDSWGWGPARIYTAASGYMLIQSKQISIPFSGLINVDFWKRAWNFPSIPNINFFIWTLMH